MYYTRCIEKSNESNEYSLNYVRTSSKPCNVISRIKLIWRRKLKMAGEGSKQARLIYENFTGNKWIINNNNGWMDKIM